MSWRFHAFTLGGDGTEKPLAWDMPLTGVQITDDLSGPGQLSATLTPEFLTYANPTGDIFTPWSTAIYATRGADVFGFIVSDTSVDAQALTLTCPGFRGYWSGLPHTGEFRGIQVDPLNVLRDEIIGHAQNQAGGNLGLTVDPLTTPVRIGEKTRFNEFTTKAGEEVSFESGPHTLAWWTTDDLGKEWDDLANETPFDYRITHTFTGNRFTHHVHLGYPQLGTKRHNLRFVAGENILTLPTISDDGNDYASDILALGAGEGSEQIHATATTPQRTRLRRVRVITDKSLRSKKRVQALADGELARSAGVAQFGEVKVIDHPNAPLGSWQVGDEIRVDARDVPWSGRVEQWVRVTSQVWDTAEDSVTMTVQKIGAQ